MRIVVGAPANGAELKQAVLEKLQQDPRVSEVVDLSRDEATYPEVSFQAAEAIAEGRFDRGVLICGTGIGTAIAANKVAGIRAATAHQIVGVRGAVENYDAQILCFGQNVIAPAAASVLIDVWLDARHDPAGSYAPKLVEIAEREARA